MSETDGEIGTSMIHQTPPNSFTHGGNVSNRLPDRFILVLQDILQSDEDRSLREYKHMNPKVMRTVMYELMQSVGMVPPVFEQKSTMVEHDKRIDETTMDVLARRIAALEERVESLSRQDLDMMLEMVRHEIGNLDFVNSIRYILTGDTLQIFIIHSMDNMVDALKAVGKKLGPVEDAFPHTHIEDTLLPKDKIMPGSLIGTTLLFEKAHGGNSNERL